MDIQGFLRWQFEGTFRSPSFYAWLIMLAGAIMLLFNITGGNYVIALGIAVMFVEIVRAWFRFSYSIYDMERQRIERELKRKE